VFFSVNGTENIHHGGTSTEKEAITVAVVPQAGFRKEHSTVAILSNSNLENKYFKEQV
jgi:hypothetical protein